MSEIKIPNIAKIIRQTIFEVSKDKYYTFDVDETTTIHELKKILCNAAHFRKGSFRIYHNEQDYTYFTNISSEIFLEINEDAINQISSEEDKEEKPKDKIDNENKLKLLEKIEKLSKINEDLKKKNSLYNEMNKIYLEKNNYITEEIRKEEGQDGKTNSQITNLKNICNEFEKYAASRKLKSESLISDKKNTCHQKITASTFTSQLYTGGSIIIAHNHK